ncbi:MAG: PEP-CTERM sorting domain-containing protein [Verrucomicrobiae bacterium]|nr:PEP-CTERM sorting domain-containing protein [Verrucomicrobiae bacterium]
MIKSALMLALTGTASASITFTSKTTLLTADSATSSTTPVNVSGLSTSLTGYTGKAMVMSTFSSQKGSNSSSLTATYRLHDGAAVGQDHMRVLTKNDAYDTGAGSVLGIADITSGSAVNLQHSRTSSKSIDLETLAGSTLTAIPLTAGGKTLDYTSLSSSSSVTNSSSSDVTVASLTGANTLSVAAVHDGTSEVFVMASFDTYAAADLDASWSLQYRAEGDTGSWTDIGKQAQRSVTANEGIVTLVGLADLSAAGNYDIQLVQRSDGSNNLTTLGANIVALSLAIDENEYLQSYEATSVGATGATLDIDLSEDMDVFAVSNITAETNGTSTIDNYNLLSNDGTSDTTLAYSTREVGSTDLGSVGLGSISSMLASNNNSFEINSTGTILEFNPDSNFVAFGLTSVPEPSSSALLALSATLFAWHRRRKN